jgi:DNA end-binding protein Ku
MSAKRTKKSSWRASWKGEVRLGLVRFTVEAVNAHSKSGSDVHFHQLHAECHSRIEYEKVCPIHGEVDQEEIVLGYETSRGRYVEVDPDELDDLRTKEERALSIDKFIAPEMLDPIYYDGRMYYLKPADANDAEPYQLFHRALAEKERIGIGEIVFSGKEQLVAVRPFEDALVMAMLNFDAEIRDVGELRLPKTPRLSAANLRVAKALVTSMEARRFDISAYEDRYRDQVKKLIAVKRKGKDIVAPPEEEEEEEPVIDFIEAMKKSLSQNRNRSSRKPRRRKAV